MFLPCFVISLGVSVDLVNGLSSVVLVLVFHLSLSYDIFLGLSHLLMNCLGLGLDIGLVLVPLVGIGFCLGIGLGLVFSLCLGPDFVLFVVFFLGLVSDLV